MEVGFLDDERALTQPSGWVPQRDEALQIALADPYGNASLIANLTEFRDSAPVVYARDGRRIRGLLCMYSGLSAPVIGVWSTQASSVQPMLEKMASRWPELRSRPAWCLADEGTLKLLTKTVQVSSAREEAQMRLDRQSYQWRAVEEIRAKVLPLTAANLEDLNSLYARVPPEAWRPEDIARGPYRGIYEGGGLVAAAGVHWVTPWIAEMGNVAVHPDYRRRGLAGACVGAVIEELRGMTEKIFLMVFADNEPAISLYRKMGFEEVRRMWLVGFRLASFPPLSRNPPSLLASR